MVLNIQNLITVSSYILIFIIELISATEPNHTVIANRSLLAKDHIRTDRLTRFYSR